jgi:hypothetical protein
MLPCCSGFTPFSADVLAVNYAMIALIRQTRRKLLPTVSYGVIHFELHLFVARKGRSPWPRKITAE